MLKFPSMWLKNASLGDQIANELRLRILENQIKPGEVLSENNIAGQYGTSRSPVRDALKALSLDGLIRLERMGAVVLGMSLDDIQELYDIREMIENFAQQKVSKKNVRFLVQALQQNIDKMELAAKYDDHSEFAYYDLLFHETIVRHAEHKRLLNLWNSMKPLLMSVILVTTERVFAQSEEHVRWVVGKHQRIVEAIESQNDGLITKTVGRYFDDSKHTLTESFNDVNRPK
ncbi:GntR family transcriptional regulator [Sporolactobacillus terrae]|uniref:GntR family transcriptional regulator n=1 Tax=Sporolactobacillus terrae TaxID=269673 RepID=A0ABX5Q5B3_9BACL|nr:GntR family transcriptional regulator [Sporolactobacillus terrae]QAA21836.1 GntR family transcriptional regulator [Sporolactobacillus terrae]QAA24809.1 GntR family transcriptional regulator [Sporolactobacillus terrae]UAK16632.1 GntR family transcriptional regulator [Sporolactobacillus terrae]